VFEGMEMKMAPIMLRPWHEVVGPLIRLEEREGLLYVEIGKIRVALPCDMKESLAPLLGRRIGIIRSDIQGSREYLVRVLPEPRTARIHDDGEQIFPGV
jgi:hypothetical protein